MEQFWEELEELDVAKDEQRFQKDGAPPHTADISMGWLKENFEEHLINRNADQEWSPHSPDLDPQIFSSGVFSKTTSIRNNPSGYSTF